MHLSYDKAMMRKPCAAGAIDMAQSMVSAKAGQRGASRLVDNKDDMACLT
jgi:hypothetical protein